MLVREPKRNGGGNEGSDPSQFYLNFVAYLALPIEVVHKTTPAVVMLGKATTENQFKFQRPELGHSRNRSQLRRAQMERKAASTINRISAGKTTPAIK
jgi:hypothetical protein